MVDQRWGPRRNFMGVVFYWLKKVEDTIIHFYVMVFQKWNLIIFFNTKFFHIHSFFLFGISQTWHATLSMTSVFNKLRWLSEMSVLWSGPAVSDLLLRIQDHTRTFQETFPLYCIFYTINVYITPPYFCIEIINLNYFWIVFKLFLIRIKCLKMFFFLMISKSIVNVLKF